MKHIQTFKQLNEFGPKAWAYFMSTLYDACGIRPKNVDRTEFNNKLKHNWRLQLVGWTWDEDYNK